MRRRGALRDGGKLLEVVAISWLRLLAGVALVSIPSSAGWGSGRGIDSVFSEVAAGAWDLEETTLSF